jgi:hypothetical protein
VTAALAVRPGQRVVFAGAASAADPVTFRRQLYPSMVVGAEADGRPVMWDPFDPDEVWSERSERLLVVPDHSEQSTVDGAR